MFSDENTSSKPYRIFVPYSREDIGNPCILFWYKRHPIQECGEGITFAKYKLSMLEHAFALTGRGLNQYKNIDDFSMNENKTIATIPTDLWIYHILCFLTENDILSFSATCKFARAVCLDDFVWKMLCFRTFQDPNILNINFEKRCYWKETYLDGKPLQEMLTQNYWRLVFIVLFQLERTRSIVHSPFLHNDLRFSECLGSILEGSFRSSKGTIILKGIQQVSFVEFIVYGYDMRSWHRRKFRSIVPLDIEKVFTDFGIVMSRSRNKLGAVRAWGCYIKTDFGERILPLGLQDCLSFKVYKFNGSYLLLCQNFAYDGASYSNEFSLFDIKLISDN